MSPNIFHLASDNHPSLFSLLQSNPSLASSQDSHGYSLLHAAASYNHVSLLRTLVQDFHLDINALKDEDDETALFVVEDGNMARMLVEEFGADVTIRNHDGQTAAEKILGEAEGEGDEGLLEVARYLKSISKNDNNGVGEGEGGSTRDGDGSGGSGRQEGLITNGILKDEPPPPVPRNLEVNLSTVPERELVEVNEDLNGRRREGRRDDDGIEEGREEVVDPEFKRRIEELAERGNLNSEGGQRELRSLVTEAVREHVTHSTSNPEGDDGSRRRNQQRRRMN